MKRNLETRRGRLFLIAWVFAGLVSVVLWGFLVALVKVLLKIRFSLF